LMTLLDKVRGAFLGCALGDALGRPFESSLSSDSRLSPLVERRASQGSLWAYSDDTQMMLSVAESILQKNRVEPEHLIQTLAKNYDPARGYGKGMKLIFQALEGGLSWQEAAGRTWAEGSKGNGAAVRVLPVACWYLRDNNAMIEAAKLSASVSHTHPIAQTACLWQVAALSYLLQSDALQVTELLQRIEKAIGGDPLFVGKLQKIAALYQKNASKEEAVQALGNGSTAEESVPLALFVFLRWAPRFDEIVINAIQCGGDTDSNAALAGALAGALLGEEALPKRWVQNLENRSGGRDDILAVAQRMIR
jgi:poly(ADP-ribose) glycohydrolase ARH3